MTYDTKPNTDDVILLVQGDPENPALALHMRWGVPEIGTLVRAWSPEETAQMARADALVAFVSNSEITAGEVLTRLTLDSALAEGSPVLVEFEAALRRAVTVAEGKLVDLHECLSEVADEDRDPVQEAAAEALTGSDFPALSDNRIHDVHLHLHELLEQRLSTDAAPAP